MVFLGTNLSPFGRPSWLAVVENNESYLREVDTLSTQPSTHRTGRRDQAAISRTSELGIHLPELPEI